MTHDARQPSAPVYIQCAARGCTTGLAIRPEHADNFDGRSWTCDEHGAKP
jgi:hypothetical protein